MPARQYKNVANLLRMRALMPSTGNRVVRRAGIVFTVAR